MSGVSQNGLVCCTLKREQPLRLLSNLFFYHFNCSEPTYKSQGIKPLKIIPTYKLERCIIMRKGNFIIGEISKINLIESKFLIARN